MSRKKKSKGTSKSSPQSPIHGRIIRALEDERYKYRTLKGVAKEAKISVERVHLEVASHPKEIVVLTRKNQHGDRLYTTRKHYSKKASTGEKIIGALINRVY